MTSNNTDPLRVTKQKFINEHKMKSGCVHCGYKEHPVALDLDHIDPSTKTYNSTKGKGKPKMDWAALGWKRLEEEMAKCQVLCANCHRIKTYFEKDYLK